MLTWLLTPFVGNIAYASEQQKNGCKAKNFDAFYTEFIENIEMQKLCTHYPLQKLEVIETQGDRVPKVVKLNREQMTYPLILTKHEQQAQRLSLKILTINNKTAKVTIYKADTGYQVIYRFKKKNTWKLIKIEDWSV